MSPKSVTQAPNIKDANIMLAILESNRGPLQIDWEQVAQKCNLKSGSVASVRFGQIKKKLGWTSSQGTTGRASRVVKARSPAKPRATGTRAASTRGSKPAVQKSPTKGAGRGGAKGKKAEVEVQIDFEAEEAEDEKKDDEAKDLMAGSEDDEALEFQESEEESFESRVVRGEYADDDVSDDVVDQLQQELDYEYNEAELSELEEKDYDAYEQDDTPFVDGVEDFMTSRLPTPEEVERPLYVPNHP